MRNLIFLCLAGLSFHSPAFGEEHDGHEPKEHEHEHSEAGFTLTAEAMASFAVQTKKLTGPGPFEIPADARVFTGEEVNLFRLRAGRWERVDFTEKKNSGGMITVDSPSIIGGDEIATHGLGFLRIAEIAASGETPAGHSH